jgi:hypothetical protein
MNYYVSSDMHTEVKFERWQQAAALIRAMIKAGLTVKIRRGE